MKPVNTACRCVPLSLHVILAREVFHLRFTQWLSSWIGSMPAADKPIEDVNRHGHDKKQNRAEDNHRKLPFRAPCGHHAVQLGFSRSPISSESPLARG